LNPSDSTADDTGVYPVSAFIKSAVMYNGATDGSKKGRLSLSLPSGEYNL